MKNCDEVQPFLEKFSTSQALVHSLSEEEWCKHFREWFKCEVAELYELEKTKKIEDLLSLARGPTQYVTSYSGYIVNGYRFHVEQRERNLRTQNSGVVVIGNTGQGDANIDFYGVLTDILELQYLGGKRVVMFRCKWFDVFDKLRGIKMDEYGFVSVNCNRQLQSNEPFILASQASQAFYAVDHINKGWHVVLKSTPQYSRGMSASNDPNQNIAGCESET